MGLSQINADTRVFGIIGWPLGHTFSPAMHNAAFEALGYNAVYLPFPVRNLRQLKHSLRQLSIGGLSVTIPYKVRIRRIIEQIDPLAVRIGSVNTIVQGKTGLFKGYNTDGPGAVKAIEESGFSIEGKNILIIGSGGSARAIGFSLLEQKPGSIGLLARNRRASLQLVRNLRLFKKRPPLELLHYPEGLSQRKLSRMQRKSQKVKKPRSRPSRRIAVASLQDPEQLRKYDLIVQTTPMGMKGHPAERTLPLTRDFLFSHQHLFDIVYNPHQTPFIKLARGKRMKVIYGQKMLIYQGALQFKLFTGLEPPLAAMEKALNEQLRSK